MLDIKTQIGHKMYFKEIFRYHGVIQCTCKTVATTTRPSPLPPPPTPPPAVVPPAAATAARAVSRHIGRSSAALLRVMVCHGCLDMFSGTSFVTMAASVMECCLHQHISANYSASGLPGESRPTPEPRGAWSNEIATHSSGLSQKHPPQQLLKTEKIIKIK